VRISEGARGAFFSSGASVSLPSGWDRATDLLRPTTSTIAPRKFRNIGSELGRVVIEDLAVVDMFYVVVNARWVRGPLG
jgi:hypothetical protein